MILPMRQLTAALIAMAALVVTAQKLWAIPLADARIIIEINGTDGDAGIQMFLDGEGWNRCDVSDPHGNTIAVFQGLASVGFQGITELFFESAEPSFDEQSLAELLDLFPSGKYRFACITTEGQRLKRAATLTHRLPAAPIVAPAAGAQVNPALPVVIAWNEVTQAFPGGELGVIDGYEIIVERLSDGRKFTIKLSAADRSVTVPPEFIKPRTGYKFEVLAIETSGNQTITESSFSTSN